MRAQTTGWGMTREGAQNVRTAWGLALGLALVVAGCGSTGDFAEAPPPELVVSPDAVTFLAVPVGESTSERITIANAGRGTARVRLALEEASSAEDSALEFVMVEPESIEGELVIEPGGEAQVEVAYRPQDRFQDAGSLVVTSGEQRVVVTLDTLPIEPDIEVSPAQIAFQRVSAGDLVQQPLTIRNIGSAPLTLGSVGLVRENPELELCRVDPEGDGEALVCAATWPTEEVPPSGVVEYTVQYAPADDWEDINAVAVRSDDADQGYVEVPISANAALPCILVTPGERVDFGATLIGNEASRLLTVTNCSRNANLELSALELGDSVDGMYGLDLLPEGLDDGPVMIETGRNVQFLVRYAPVDQRIHESSVTLRSNDPSRPEVVVPLQGRGSFDTCPASIETCNGLDDDCDGEIDEGVLNTCGVCGDATDVCDGIDNDCDGEIDEDTSREVCNGLDDDCDGEIDENVAAPEICDGEDNDCDGEIDEGVLNACGACGEPPLEVCDGEDNDCDGEIDEFVANPCGPCGTFCEDTRRWGADDGTLALEDASGLVVSEAPPGLTLGQGSLEAPYVWVANSAEGTVSKIDVALGREVDRYTVGQSPSRTAVDLDGNVWVANRSSASVHRVRAEGCEGQGCVDGPIQVGSGPRGVAVDADNNVWVGSWSEGNVMRISPDTLQVEQVVPLGTPVYGMAIDADGILWVAGRAEGVLGKIDTETGEVLAVYDIPLTTSLYGIAVDGFGRVWLGNFALDNVLRFDPTTLDWEVFQDPSAQTTRGVAVDGFGNVWVANSNSNTVSKFRAEDGALLGSYAVGAHPIGVAVDAESAVWVVNRNDNSATQLSPEGETLATVGVGAGPYTYSDMSGFQLRNFTARQGAWSQVVDCAYVRCDFDRLTWSATVPEGSEVIVRARTSDDGEQWTPWSEQGSASPLELDLEPGRFCELWVRLQSSDEALRPVLHDVELHWVYR